MSGGVGGDLGARGLDVVIEGVEAVATRIEVEEVAVVGDARRAAGGAITVGEELPGLDVGAAVDGAGGPGVAVDELDLRLDIRVTR